jgi:hypothetical protein
MLLEHRRIETILKLNKALYSLQKLLLLWQKEITNSIRKLGFEAVPYKLCCFIKDRIIMFFYIDNIVFAFKKYKRETILELIN